MPLKMICRIELPVLSAVALTLAIPGCVSTGRAPSQDELTARIAKHSGHGVRIAPGTPEFPAGTSADDGLTSEEAVAIALWNNPDFQGALADLGIARAEVAQAGLLRNPVFSLLLPWGPKQLEATLRWPIEALWQRPRRVAAAHKLAEAVAERLTAGASQLVLDVRMSHVDLRAAQARSARAEETAGLARRVAELVRKRYDAGDISRLESDAAAVDADRASELRKRVDLERTLSQHRLHQLLGVGDLIDPGTLRAVDSQARAARPEAAAEVCGVLADLQKDALAFRPDLRAAELDIEAAAARLGWERSRIFSLVGILDANAEGQRGFEMGPGVETDFGLLDRNQPGVLRAAAELDRGKARYASVRQRIVKDLRDAFAQADQARQAFAAWGQDIRPRLEQQAGQTERAYQSGELSYLAVLEAMRRVEDARVLELESETDLRRALVRLEHSAGRRCDVPE